MPDMENGTKIIFFQKKNIFSKLLEDLKFTNNRYTIDASVYTKKGPLSSFYKEKTPKTWNLEHVGHYAQIKEIG